MAAENATFENSRLWKDASNGIRCCCDVLLGLKDVVCKYAPLQKDGSCPVVDFGRGVSQTHFVQRLASRCSITDQVRKSIPENIKSDERYTCEATFNMDSKIFPPEKHGTNAFRLAFANVRGIGDLYIGIGNLQLLEVDIMVQVVRRGDRRFTFQVVGADNQPYARLKAYIQGLDVHMPDSSLRLILGGVTAVNDAIGSIRHVFSPSTRNYASLKNTPVDLELFMRGDFEVMDNGEWQIVEGSAQHHAHPRIASGGFINELINIWLRAAGGVDRFFFETIWPVVAQIIQITVSNDFLKIPHQDGCKMYEQAQLRAWCPNIVKETCPTEDMEVELIFNASASFFPRGVIPALLEAKLTGTDIEPFLPLMEQVNKVYQSDPDAKVLPKSSVKSNVAADMTVDKSIEIRASPNVRLPMTLIRTLAPDLPLENFLGAKRNLEAFGSATVQDGVLEFRDVSIRGLSLPIGVEDDADLEIRGTVESLSVQLEDADEDDPLGELFSQDDALFSVLAPGFHLTVSKEGAFLKPQQKVVLAKGAGKLAAAPGAAAQRPAPASRVPDRVGEMIYVDLNNTFIHNKLKTIGDDLIEPAAVRTADSRLADGEVPKEFRTPHSTRKRTLNLPKFLHSVHVESEWEANGKCSDPVDKLKVHADLKVTGKLQFGHDFWQGVMDSTVNTDLGYLYLTVAGFYGVFDGKNMVKNPALAVLSCGNVAIYKLQSSSWYGSTKTVDPFSVEPSLDIDLKDPPKGVDWQPVKINVVTKSKANESAYCVTMFKSGTGGSRQRWMCSKKKDDIMALHRAMKIQMLRFKNAAKRWRHTCVPGADGHPSCAANPDGTWFRTFEPFDRSSWQPGRLPPKVASDVRSPHMAWQDAVLTVGQ